MTHIMFIYIFGLFLQLIQMTNSKLFGLSKEPQTIKQIDINKYLGKWYQVYGASVNYVFQGYGKCITAEYSLLPNNNIYVLNSQFNSENVLQQISGYAYYTNNSEPGKLKVHLDGVPFEASYWIIELGEIKNEQYQYSIVTAPLGLSLWSLWVLVRDIESYYSNYDKEVIQILDSYNYNYVTIKQGYEDCSFLTI